MLINRTSSPLRLNENGGLDGFLDRFLVPDVVLPVQGRSPSAWSPEKRLAGAVLATALVGIRDHYRDPAYRMQIVEDLEWIAVNDDAWPFSFLGICQMFDLNPDWVRAQVRVWMQSPPPRATNPSERLLAQAMPPASTRRTTFAALA